MSSNTNFLSLFPVFPWWNICHVPLLQMTAKGSTPLKGQKQMSPRSLFSTILYLLSLCIASIPWSLCASELWSKTSSTHCKSVLGFILDRKSSSHNTCHARWEGFSSFFPVNSQTFSNICRNAMRSEVSTYTCNHIDFMSCWGFNREKLLLRQLINSWWYCL